MPRSYKIAEFVEALADNPYASTGDIADIVGCSNETAVKHLSRLCDDGAADLVHDGRFGFLWAIRGDVNGVAGFILRKKVATYDEIAEAVKMKRGSVIKHVSNLKETGLVMLVKTKANKTVVVFNR